MKAESSEERQREKLCAYQILKTMNLSQITGP